VVVCGSVWMLETSLEQFGGQIEWGAVEMKRVEKT
jgi:hypothetical protein